MTSLNDLRSHFLGYFGGNDHLVIPSAPLVPQSDPTLLFVNAGMVPFKNIFTGAETPPAGPPFATPPPCPCSVARRGRRDGGGQV